MEYYGKYFSRYKEIMDPVINWKKKLNIKEKTMLYSQLFSGFCLLIIEVIVFSYITNIVKKNSLAIGIAIVSIVVVTLITMTKWSKSLDNTVKKYKHNVAIYMGYENFNNLLENKRKDYIEYLKDEGIDKREQYKILNEGINKELDKHKPKKLLNYGIIGAVALPFWNTLIQQVFKEFTIIYAAGIGGVCIAIFAYLLLVVEKVSVAKNEVSELINNDIYRLKEMKSIILELELKSIK